MSTWQPHVVVAAVVERDGKYLLVEEFINGELCLNQPAGHWEAGETLEQGVVRETLEESGWDVQPTHLLGVYEWKAPNLPYPFVRLAYVATALRHHPERVLDTGILRAVWLTPDELQACAHLHRSPTVWACVADHLAGRRYPLDLVKHLA